MAIELVSGPGNLLLPQGIPGKSAYQVWMEAGNIGTMQDYLASLGGTPGRSAYESWQLAGNSGNEAQFLASLKGDDGVSATHPLLVTGKTGGNVDSICIPSLTSPSTLIDAVNSMKAELYDGAPLYYRASVTEVYAAGGVIPGTFTSADLGKLVALGDKNSPVATNRSLYARGTLPATLTPSANKVFLPLGVVESLTSWRFTPGQPITEADSPVQYFESFGSVANGAAVPTTLISPRWDSANETLTAVVDGGNTPTLPQGRYLRANSTAGSRRAHALVESGLFTDGPVGITFYVPTGQTLSGRAVRVYGRVSGNNSAQTGLVADLNLGTGRLKLFHYLAGLGSADLAITTGNAITGGASAALNVNTLYRLEIWPIGNRVLSRAYLFGGTVPDWQVETYQTAVTGAGYAAFGAASGALDLRIAHMAVTKNYGSLKAAP